MQSEMEMKHATTFHNMPNPRSQGKIRAEVKLNCASLRLTQFDHVYHLATYAV